MSGTRVRGVGLRGAPVSPRLLFRLLAAVGALALSALALVSPSALAAKSLNGFIGGLGGVSDAGFFTQETRDSVVYTAADSNPANDKIFVVESSAFATGTKRLQRLDAHGNPELVIGTDVVRAGAPGDTGTGPEICDVAISGAGGCKRGESDFSPGGFDDPTGVAVNQSTGTVYVLERDNHRVQQFTLDGEFVRAWGWDVVASGPGDDTSAPVDEFEVCEASAGDVCKAGVSGFGVGQLGATSVADAGIAVEPAAAHDVFVADPGNQRVLRFNSDGSLDVSPSFGASEFSESYPRSVAVDPAGVVYAGDGGSSDRIVRYDTGASSFLAPLDAPLLAPGTTKGLEVDDDTGQLFVVREPAAPAGPFVAEIADPATVAPSLVANHIFDTENPVNPPTVLGLGYNPTVGALYLSTFALHVPPAGVFAGCDGPAESVCSGLVVLDDSAVLSATMSSISDVGNTAAVVSGTVDPGGGVARYSIEVSVDGQNWSRASRERLTVTPQVVSVTLSGLQPNSFYRARLRVSKLVGMDEVASVVTGEEIFLTDAKEPIARTLGTTRRTATTVRLRARIDPEGAATTYRFEYGPVGSSFDHHVPIPDASAGSGNSEQLFFQDVIDLLPETTYQYRVVASNFAGTGVGETRTFTTLASDSPPPPATARAYELVSAEKLGGQGAGEWYKGIGSHALAGLGAYTGSRFAVRGELGVVLADGAYAYASDWALAERTSSGWVNKPAMNRQAYGRQSSRMLALTGSNEDMSLTTWNSNSGLLRLFEEMREWNDLDATFARDWEGDWEVIGPTDPAQDLDAADPFGSRVVATDGSMIVFSSRLRGLAGAGDPGLGAVDAAAQNVYSFVPDVSAGLTSTFPGQAARSVVNVCTAGTTIPSRSASGELSERACPPLPPGRDASLVDPRGAALVRVGDRTAERALSDDGSRVFFMAPDPELSVTGDQCSGEGATTTCPSQLYVRTRKSDGSFVTRWIARSEVSGQAASLMAPVSFEGASRDGDKVLLRTATPLTADDPNGKAVHVPGGVTSGNPSPDSVDLFLYDFPDDAAADPADGELTRISGGPGGASDPNVVTGAQSGESGAARFFSDDGSRLYFVSAAPLDGVGVPGNGTVTEPGGSPTSTDAMNLYLFDANKAGDGRWAFVARLPRSSELGRCATTNFMGGASLSNLLDGGVEYDRGNCVRGASDGSMVTFWTDGQLTDDDPDGVSGDIYGYDAVRDDLVRLSAPQGGAGGTYPCAPETSSIGCYGDPGFGKPASMLSQLGVGVDPNAPGDPMAFFQSRSRLVAEDVDDGYDVYQWRSGELTLVSTGQSEGEGVFYQGNSHDGQTVFLSTRDRLTWQDQDAVMDVYAARVGGGFAPPVVPTCDTLGGRCQSTGSSELPPIRESGQPGDGDVELGDRAEVTADPLSRRRRQRAARTGVLAIGLRATAPGKVTVIARARVGGRSRRVGRTSVLFRKAGRKVVRVHLNFAIRRALARRRSVVVSVSAAMAGSRADELRVSLDRRGRR
jgi:hypothetical protein